MQLITACRDVRTPAMELMVQVNSFEYTYEHQEFSSLVGLSSSGDVYRGNEGIAYYTTRWFPRTERDLELLVVLVPNHSPASFSSAIGFSCPRDSHFFPTIIDASQLPEDWRDASIPLSRKAAIETNKLYGEQPVAVASAILQQDRYVREFVTGVLHS